MNQRVYEQVTATILAEIEKGVLPWQRPWSTALPMSYKNREYRGLNQLLLSLKAFSDPRWITFNALSNLGGRVPKGTKSSQVVHWAMFECEDKSSGEMRRIPTARIYHVFNLEQCENHGLPKFELQQCDGQPIKRAEAIIENVPWKLTVNQGQAAFWSPSSPDAVTMPEHKSFRSREQYYSTLFHEIIHATGHESRLNRDLAGKYGDEKYGLEELVAEFGAAFLCAKIGIDNSTEQTASYISGWADAFRRDPKLILRAASLAQRAADFILGVKCTGEAGFAK